MFLCKFMSNRQFQVWLGMVLSPRDQSSVLPSLPLPSVESRGGYITLSCAPYMSMTSLFTAGPNLKDIQQQLQLTINWLSLWSQENGFKFLCIHFCQLGGVFPHPNLVMDNTPLPFAETVRFLGLILDSHLTREPHTYGNPGQSVSHHSRFYIP
jgi:hypothetical protein